jgi:hypothetical protein
MLRSIYLLVSCSNLSTVNLAEDGSRKRRALEASTDVCIDANVSTAYPRKAMHRKCAFSLSPFYSPFLLPEEGVVCISPGPFSASSLGTKFATVVGLSPS